MNPWLWAPLPPAAPPLPILTLSGQQRRDQVLAAAKAVWDVKQERQLAATKIVDTPEQLSELVDTLWLCGGLVPMVVMDCEGFNDYRLECDVIEIYHIPSDHLYLIDIFVLGTDILNLRSAVHKYTLAAFLESDAHLKLIYDCRQDSNALFMSYNIQLDGVVDLSLMVTELRRRHDPAFHHRVSVDDAIKIRLRNTDIIGEFEHQAIKEAKSARNFMGILEAWAQRPLDNRLVRYSQDVRLMGVLYVQSLAVHYTGSPTNLQSWQTILNDSYFDARMASTARFQRDSIRSVETPWSPRYWIDPLAGHPQLVARRQSSFQAKISARRIQGHKIRIPNPPEPSAAELRRAQSFTARRPSMTLSPSFLRELRGEPEETAETEAAESDVSWTMPTVTVAPGTDPTIAAAIVAQIIEERPVERLMSAPADMEANLGRYLYPSSSRWV